MVVEIKIMLLLDQKGEIYLVNFVVLKFCPESCDIFPVMHSN